MRNLFSPPASPLVNQPELQELRNMPTTMTAPQRAALPLRVAATAAFAAVLATTIAGCDTPRIADEVHPRLSDPSRRHPITVVAETATLDIEISPAGKGADARAYIETTKYMRNYGYEGRGPMTIAVPRNAGGRASHRVQAVRLAAHRAGVPSNRLRVVPKSDAFGTITLSYDRIAAIGPTCGDWSSDVSRNPENLPYNNFGCASQRNLAAMAATPTDLMFPARESARGSETRSQDAKNFNTNLGKMIPPSSK
jgi:pilus assembly protein CpaD